MQDTIFYRKSWQDFLPVRDCSEFPQKLKSWGKDLPLQTWNLVLDWKTLWQNFRRQLVIKNWLLQHSEWHRGIMCKGTIGIASSFQCIITKPKYKKTLYSIRCRKIFSYYQGLQWVVLVMRMDAITYVADLPILSSNYFDNIYKWVHTIHWEILIFLF